jgi:tetratricopeptide (TPR) repeat protein
MATSGKQKPLKQPAKPVKRSTDHRLAQRAVSSKAVSAKAHVKPAKTVASRPKPAAVVTPTQAASPSPPGPPREAIGLFEQGISALQRHAYASASEAFSTLLSSYPGERTLLDRARVYLDICARESRRQPALPETSEERLTAATLALNNGREVEAENLAKRVLADDPRQDLAAYLLAVIAARRGHLDAALQFLRQAVTINPESRAQARHDEDFDAFQDLEAFRSLTDSAVQTPAAAQVPPPVKTARRGRADR